MPLTISLRRVRACVACDLRLYSRKPLADLLKRRRRVLETLPPLDEVLRGSVVERSICCGRAGCHCAGGDGHRVTYLSVTHPGGRTEQISLPAALVAAARRGVATYQRWWKIVEHLSAINREILRDQRKGLRRTPTPPKRRRRR